MKKRTSRNQRVSLILAFTGLIMILLLGITVIAAIIVFILVNSGSLQIGGTITSLNLGSFILTLLILNAIIGAILAALTTNIILKPINKIFHSLNRLASGDYSARLNFQGPVSRISTIRELTDSFNTMARELEQTEMLRSDFINNFSHEFKTPIVSIAGFAQLLKRGNPTPEEQAEYLDVIEKESLRLARMATNVLDLTRIENQNILTDQVSFNVSEQLRTCMLLLEGKWTEKQIEPVLPVEEHYIVGNEDLMKQVWNNLFDNAIKFSSAYGSVEALIEEKEGRTDITISNYGDPIPEESIDKIFSKFYQADESHASEGNGVGLAVVKKIVELHRGSVRVLCQNGKTSFIVSLPQKTA
ncbi:MAG: HAMP domain-containing protein [Parasporobacterium sp.]|nr:HAMP domain-containing protein [Parasporobacterium sp.]